MIRGKNTGRASIFSQGQASDGLPDHVGHKCTKQESEKVFGKLLIKINPHVVVVMMTALNQCNKVKMTTCDLREKLTSPIFRPQSDQHCPTTKYEGLTIDPLRLDLAQIEH
eukprot:TRINITY_DN9442_c0_g2_i2.p1 TRINITY_DN9442_c0_g2~~TRINITY_DN9442_c0_g2_i2.p1  ORF type:complete len:111 (+),score=6.03 TRINITY_DN9442_c0_g2_i2:85-417(+)